MAVARWRCAVRRLILFTAIRVSAAAIPSAAVCARMGAMITAVNLGAS
jgi:hypothetical protein